MDKNKENNKISNDNNSLNNENMVDTNFPNNENNDFQENPYYNPYFQNDSNTNNSPYVTNTDSNVNLNNSIYTNNQNSINTDNELYNNNLNNNNDSNNMQLNNEMSNEDNSSINLFDLSNEQLEDINNTNNTNNTTNNNINYDNQNNINENVENISNMQNIPDDNTTLNNNINDMNNIQNMQNYNFGVNSGNNLDNNSNYNLDNNFNSNLNNEVYQENTISNNPDINSNNIINNDINNNNMNNFNNNNFNDNNNNNYYGNDNNEEFKKAYMGNLYEKVTQNKKFSIPAFFFGGIYFFYRKLYLFGFIFTLLSCLPIINNIICGFVFYPLYKSSVNKKLNKYKNVTQNPNQLIDLAKNKGGTSILAALLSIVILTAIIIVILIISLPNILQNLIDPLIQNPQSNPQANNTINNNEVYEQTAQYDTYNFYNDYILEYDSLNWTLDESSNSLVNGNYKLSFIQSLENLSTSGYDINTESGRSTFFTFLYNQFSAQIDTTTTLELGSSNFTYSNGLYYAYLDLVYSASIERCYFILIPENDIFLELVLSNQDTVIANEIHNEITEYITTIKLQSESDLNASLNDITNTLDSNTVTSILSNFGATLESQATVAHNSSFEAYFGTSISGPNAKALFTSIRNNNNTAQEEIGHIIYLVDSPTSTNEISQSDIQMGKKYTINVINNNSSDELSPDAGYWSNGFIKTIYIQENQ